MRKQQPINMGNNLLWIKKHSNKLFKSVLAFSIMGLMLYPIHTSAQSHVTFDGYKSTWHGGFTRYDFIMDDSTLAITPFKQPDNENFDVQNPPAGKHRCIVIAPKVPAAGNPWSWRGCYWDHQPQTEIELLHRGFYIVYISANSSLKPDKHWDAWYNYLVAKGLSAKPEFIGMSLGGEYEFTWATAHPDEVSAMYADNPYIPAEFLAKVSELAKHDVPLLHVCGSIDPLYNFCTLPVESIYQAFGSRISVIVKEGSGHHPHSLNDPKIIADFMEKSFNETKSELPGYTGKNALASWLYSDNFSYIYSSQEKKYLTCRGAVFSQPYRRYQVTIAGVDAFTTIIAPKTPAPGNPWIFRADAVKRDDTVAFALLKKGYYIVTGAVPYNYDGPTPDQWNKIYAYLLSFGFSAKPIMSGYGGAAGEAFAWAINNPGKVAGIYMVNPILTSNMMLKTNPIDSLGPLAKANIPILFVCGDKDPSLKDQSLIVQKQYKKLGGKITVIVKNNGGHYLPKGDEELIPFITKLTKQ